MKMTEWKPKTNKLMAHSEDADAAKLVETSSVDVADSEIAVDSIAAEIEVVALELRINLVIRDRTTPITDLAEKLPKM